jgi:hypothetical protein
VSDEKAGIGLMMLAFILLFTMAWTSIANAQSTTVCTSDTVVGNYGVDGDLYANSPSALNPQGPHDDWFQSDTIPGPGIGVIGTTAATSVPVGLSAAQFRAIISNPASDRNRTYVQRMAVPPLTPRFVAPGIGYLLLDAVAARDNHTAGSAKDSSCFTSGSDKNGANPNTWSIGTGGVQQKNDLIDAGGHIRREYNFITNDAGDLWGYAFATTRNTSGDAHTDFEIFRTAPEIVGGMLTNTGPDGGHTAGLFNTADGSVAAPGDVLVAVDYANGGTNPQASVRIWIDPNNVDGAGMDTATLNTMPNRPFEFTGVFDGGTGSGTYGYAEIRPLSGSTADCLFWSVTNDQDELGTPWGSLTSQNAAFSDYMETLQCVSVAINFSAFGLDLNPVGGPCFNLFGSLMVKSRSSGSFTSEMKDFMGPFVFGNFQEVNGEITGGGNLSCQTTSVTLCASTTTPGATFTWSVVPGSGGHILANNDSCIVVDSAGCYVLEVANPSLATCTTTDTLCVIGTPDTDPPTINCPSNATYACIEDVPDCPKSWAEFLAQGGTASDSSGIDTSSYSVNCGSLVGGECGGTITRVFTISDNCGNTATCTQTIGVNDNIPPVVTNCPSGGDLGCNPTTIPAADTSAFTATDNCMKLSKTWSDVVTGTCNKMLTRTYTATDSCNNSVTCQQIFTWIDDTTDPVFTSCPPSQNLGCNPSTFPGPGTATATDNCGTANVTAGALGAPVNTNGCVWTRTRIYTATDTCGNTATCAQVFTYVIDNTPPVITSCPPSQNLGCNPSTFPGPGTATATDNCGAANVTAGPLGAPVNTNGCNWTRTRIYTATDACGNTSTCSQVFTYTVDTIAPVFTFCPPAMDLGCNPTAIPPAGEATATDNCGGTPVITAYITPVIKTGCNKTRSRIYVATDACGNTATCEQVYTWRQDTKPPVVNCGKDITVCDGTKVDINPTVTDDCDSTLQATCTRSDNLSLNDPFPVGITTVTCSATDACGNTGTCSINVSVIDIPTCSIPAPMDLPVCGTAGYTLSAITSGTDSSTTYTWSVVTNDPLGVPWTITGGQGTPSITYSAGSGVATFTLIITNSANGVNCSSQCELMIACVNDRFCTYTQGFYGNAGGKACNGEDTPHFLAGLLTNPLVVGGGGNTLTLTQADVISGCFFTRLPGGGWSKPLNGAATCNNPVGIWLQNGTFRNTLLNQTITMGLNLRIPGNGLDSLHLTGVYLTTYASNGVGCDDNSAQPIPGTAQVWQLPGNVISYLGANNTVADLYALANQALAGTYVPGNGDPGLGQIAQALDVLNNAFDECRMLGGFDNKPPSVAQVREIPDVPNYEGITMNAYPNPFNMMASIEFKLDGFDSNVTLDVFTLTGEKVATLYNGHANADETYKVELDGSVLPAGIYVYQLNTGDRVYNDKLVLIK